MQQMQPIMNLGSVQKTTAYVFALAIILVRAEIAFGERVPLAFSLILSYGRSGYNSSGTIPAIDLALEHINSLGVLGEYQLQYSTVKDSGCNREQSLSAFLSDFVLEPDPVKIALIGCGCSVATEPVAEISHLWNISQISFASAVSTLSDRTRFKNFFRTISNFDLNVPALLSILNHYGWNRIAFLTHNVNLFQKFFADFRTLLENLRANNSDVCCFNNASITVVNWPYSTNKNPKSAIGDIFEKMGDFRVFFVNSYSANARRVICEAAKRNLTYPRYAWIMFGWYPDKWWTGAVARNNLSCSDEQLEVFIENARTVLIQHNSITDDVNGTTIAGITPRQFDDLYEGRRFNQSHSSLLTSTFAYDAVWTLALALNRTQDMFLDNSNVTEIGCGGLDGGLAPLEQFNYSNGVMGCVIRWNLERSNFSGVSGHVSFDENGTIFQKGIWLMQYRRQSLGIERVRFGFVDKTDGFAFTYEGRDSDRTIYPDGIPPDGTPETIIHTVQLGLLISYYILAVVGITFGIICLGFNFAFRKRKVVQLTSPKLNYLIIAGSLLMYCSVFIDLLYTTDKTTVHIQCILHIWMYLLGYLMAFGTILAKMWRVYQIFHNPTPNKMVPRDWHLAVVVLLLTSISIPLAMGESASQVPVLVRDDENREGRTALGVREKNYVWVCYEPGSPAFYCNLVIFLYLALLQIVGIVLAFQTRKVKIPVLNDSKFVAALVYISSIVFVVLALDTFYLRGYINVSKATFSGGILLLATSFLILTFVPKMLILYSDPRGKKIFDKSNPVTAMESISKQTSESVSIGTQSEPETALEEKERRISELEKELHLIKTGEANNLNAQE